VYHHPLQQQIELLLKKNKITPLGQHQYFYARLIVNAAAIQHLYEEVYPSSSSNPAALEPILQTIITAYLQRSTALKQRDEKKIKEGLWFLSNQITGMSLYVDRFCGSLSNLQTQLVYFKELGVNLLHLMPLFESPEGESDGGYAVSNFRKVDPRYGTLQDLQALQKAMQKENMYLMLDIVFNHTSNQNAWAQKAKAGEAAYQNYFYMFPDRTLPDQFEQTMREIFPEAAPGNFTYVPECKKWVMTVFHHYQWDLNYSNPAVLQEMLDIVFFYANLGVDILRIDAPACIWKQVGTNCNNLPQAHAILQLTKLCVQVAAPGMALLGEAIVAPKEILKYFGTGRYAGKECDLAYNASHMALQWDALATGDTKVMLAAQYEILQKPYGTSWINYTRCHDDIGLVYEDYMIQQAGYLPYQHRSFIKNYYTGNHPSSVATGALFSVNHKTGDARISGSLASLCGLEKAWKENNRELADLSVRKIILMQAHSLFLGGIPMLFYGDELGCVNDYTYLQDPAKSYDNRWMHRPMIDATKKEKRKLKGSIEQKIFSATQRLIQLRNELSIVADHKNITWLTPHNIHIAGYLRTTGDKQLYGLFNFSAQPAFLTWYVFKEHGRVPAALHDYWRKQNYTIGSDHEYLVIEPYEFHLMEGVNKTDSL
jgi:amylosucrase